jgi:ribonuclease III
MRPNSSHTGKRRRNRARGQVQPPGLTPEQRDLCEAALGHRFRSPVLLDRALTHRSAVQGHAAEWSNERLEFLGDRVLGLTVARHLLERFPRAREGELAPKLNSVVSRETCAAVGEAMGLAPLIIVDRAERGEGGSLQPSLVSNAVEALLGAIYLDAGEAAAERCILHHFRAALQSTETLARDPKSELQEWAQGEGLPAPTYRHEGRAGPDHAPRFSVTVFVEGHDPSHGEGASKQDAERAAARSLLARLAETTT